MTNEQRMLELGEPRRVQLSRKKGWRMPPNTVKVDRSTIYGNPYPLSYFGGDREACVAEFRKLAELPPLRDMIPSLVGKNVACWCSLDQPCHADVWLDLARVASLKAQSTDTSETL